MNPRVLPIAATVLLPILAVAQVSAQERLTTNLFNDTWSPFHSGIVGEKMLWSEADERVIYFDGTSAAPIQDYDGGDPALDLIASFAMGLGSGASPNEVVGAWRRGADYAWVWTSGGSPVQIDVPGTNPFVPGGAANPEAFSIADGCVFTITQASDPNDGGTGNVYKNAFLVDPADGSVTPVSGNARAFGPDRIVSSDCRAAWVTDPNDDIVTIGQPFELRYWDGSTTVTLDRGRIDKFSIDFDGDAVVYVKEVDVYPQVFVVELDGPAPAPRQLTDTIGDKKNPRTDGRHIAWGERRDHPLNGFQDQMDIRMPGGVRVSPHRNGRPNFGDFELSVDGGQMIWQRAPGLLGVPPLQYFADNQRTEVSGQGYASVLSLHLSDGWFGWYGSYTGENDTEITRMQGVAPQDLSFAPPPLIVQAFRGPSELRVIWDEVLGVDDYTVYVAQETGIGPGNYAILQGGARYDQARSPFVIPGIDPAEDYYVVVASNENGGEGSPSGEGATSGFLVNTINDTLDANPGDGACEDSAGNCSLRAAITESAWDPWSFPTPTIAVPAGFYVLSLQGQEDENLSGDLDVHSPVWIMGDGIDQTIVHGGGTAEAGFEIDRDGSGIAVRISDLSVRNAEQGIQTFGELRLDRVRLHDNGGGNVFPTGAALGTPLQEGLTELYDCQIDTNITGSHGGGLFLGHDVDIFRSEISGNTAGIGGGGIYVIRGRTRLTDTTVRDNTSIFQQNWAGGGILHETGDLQLRRSAVLNNTAPACGGGIYTLADRTSLISSTVSGNSAIDGGGGICTVGDVDLEMVQSTFAFNTAPVSPTLSLGDQAAMRFRSSIFFNTQGDSDCVREPGGYAISSSGMNFGALASCVGPSQTYMDVDPLLEPIADNGGFTLSHALQDGSPALDAVPDGLCFDQLLDPVPWDQRGVARPIDYDGDGLALCDSGAVEAEAACIDGDGDGFPASDTPGCLVGVPVDCNDDDADSWQLPGTNGTLLFSDPDNFAWTPTGSPGGTVSQLVHEIYRADSPSNLASGGICGATAPGTTSGTDAGVPAPGEMFVYLTRATNGCAGESPWGTDSEGVERPVACP